MSVTIFSPDNPSAPIRTINFPSTATLDPQLPAYNKHRDGDWPTTERQRAYVKQQRELYNANMVRLYHAFEDTMSMRLLQLDGDYRRVQRETSVEVQAQAHHLYYDRVWNKEHAPGAGNDFLLQIYRFWRNVGTAQEHLMYDLLWEFVADAQLPKRLLTAAHERMPWE